MAYVTESVYEHLRGVGVFSDSAWGTGRAALDTFFTFPAWVRGEGT